MKIFLNVIGILAMMSGPVALFVGRDPVSQMLGGVVLLVAVCALGLAKLIELGDAEAKAAKEQRKLERDFWKTAVVQLAQVAPKSGAELPSAPRWYVANGEAVTGPFTRDQLSALQQKGVITAETRLNPMGTEDWLECGAVMS